MANQVGDSTVEALVVPLLMREEINRVKSVRLLAVDQSVLPQFEMTRTLWQTIVVLGVEPDAHHVGLAWIVLLPLVVKHHQPALQPVGTLHELVAEETALYMLRHLREKVLIEAIVHDLSCSKHHILFFVLLLLESLITLKH